MIGGRRRAMRAATAAIAVTAAIAAGALSAAAPSASAQEPAGSPVENYGMVPGDTQAGSHPDLQVGFTVKNAADWLAEDGLKSPCFCQNDSFLTVHAPAGVLGSPSLIPKCNAAQFAAVSCPVDSQVGVVAALLDVINSPDGAIYSTNPVYNLEPRQGEPGLLGYIPASVPILQTFAARTESDYGLDSTVVLWNGQPIGIGNAVLWGVPASPKHNRLRFALGELLHGPTCDANGDLPPPSPYVAVDLEADKIPTGDPYAPPSGPDSFAQLCDDQTRDIPSDSPEVPFITAPTNCAGEQPTSIDVTAFDAVTTHADATYPATTGCDLLQFNPSLSAKPTTTEADSPSGLDVTLTVPQPQDPGTPSPSSIRATKMTLPAGFTVNSAAADGKSACTDAQAAFGTRDAARCPEDSKVGTLEIDSAVLPGPLPGYLYLGAPLPGNRYRAFLVADGFGVHVKLAGTIDPDPNTGQLSVVFTDLPQAPFEKFSLHVFGAERGALATPTRCGTYPVKTEFTPWDDQLPTQTATQFFTIDQGPGGGPCPSSPRSFNPTFQAGSQGNTAGAHSPFAVDIQRPDGDQYLTGLTVKTPPGFSATLKGVPYCPQAAIDQLGNSLYSGLAEIASSACPTDSQVGTVTGGAGAGSKPFYAPGKVYLAGPYKGAPLSILAVIPAVSGPYDLGNVAVRNPLYVDPTTAQVTTTSDPLPPIIGGIPLRTRSVRVNLDRPDFAINPTNCSPFSVDATLSGDEGATSSSSVPFQVANCANLPFGPKLSIALRGGHFRNGHPAFTSVLTGRGGDANIGRVQVVLPPTMQLDQSHITAPCTRPQFAADQCPAASVIGSVTATSPLLDQTLSGPVYLRTGNNPLPDLVLDLHGPASLPIRITQVGKVDTVNARLRTTFDTVPDAPIAKAVISLEGGHKGLLVNNTDICANRAPASVAFSGQNGRTAARNVSPALPCRKARKHKRHHKRHARHRRHAKARRARLHQARRAR